MKKLRILSLILAMLMLAMPFASCDKEPENPDGGNDPTTTETTLDIITEGVANYVIVRDYKAGGEVLDAINTVVSAVKEFTGADITVKECYSDREEESDVPTEKEILIGNTNRPETAQAFSTMRSGDWVIGVYGTKLVVGSPSDAGTISAIAKFKNAYIYEQGNKYQVKSYVQSNGREGSLMSLSVSTSQGTAEKGTYSYSLYEVMGARIDSFLIAYAKNDDAAAEMAEKLQAYISKETGFELITKKDTRAYGDYEILIGDTIRTEDELVEKLGDDDYYIKLNKTETGAQLIFLFGKNAADAALQAFRTNIMPASKTPITKNLEDGLCITNMK